MVRSNSNAQPQKRVMSYRATFHMADAVTSSACSFDVPGFSPTTISYRTDEHKGARRVFGSSYIFYIFYISMI